METALEGGEGWKLDAKGAGWVEKNAQERGGLMNLEHAICNGHLPYPWGQRWVAGESGELDAAGGEGGGGGGR